MREDLEEAIAQDCIKVGNVLEPAVGEALLIPHVSSHWVHGEPLEITEVETRESGLTGAYPAVRFKGKITTKTGHIEGNFDVGEPYSASYIRALVEQGHITVRVKDPIGEVVRRIKEVTKMVLGEDG